MKNSLVCYFIISNLFLLLIFSGCGSTPPSRFYTLHPLEDLEGKQSSTSSDNNISIAIGPVEIPDYLDRPQIAVRKSQDELSLSEYERWAGSLREDIVRVLSEDISKRMASDHLSVVEWGRGGGHDYRVAIEIKQFDIMPDGNVVLTADWTLLTRDGRRLTTRRDSITEPIHEQTYESRVAAMSRALAALSRNIADELNSVLPKLLSERSK